MENSENILPERDVVLVTGFGPFGEHSVNASWEAVKLLPTLGLGEELGVQLVIKQIPVEYAYIQENIPKLWDTYKPRLVIHVGVSEVTSEICLEQESFNVIFNWPDEKGNTPVLQIDRADCALSDNSICGDALCVKDGPSCIVSDINMDQVCAEVNEKSEAIACVSRDPGRYMSNFIYYYSLQIDRARTAFIHVPPLDEPYSVQQLAEALKLAIQSMLSQVPQNDEVKSDETSKCC